MLKLIDSNILRLNRVLYKIFTSHFLPFLVITLCFAFIIWIIEAVKIVEMIVSRGLSLTHFFELSFYLLPYLLFMIIPVTTLCCLLYIVKKLKDDRELIILEYIGLDHKQILRPFLYFAIIVTAIHYSISFYFLPVSYKHFQSLENKIRNHYASLIFEPGTFSNRVSDLTIYVDKKISANEFKQIFIYDGRNPNRSNILIAEKGIIKRNIEDNTIGLSMYNGSSYQENLNEHKGTLLFFDDYHVTINLANPMYDKRVIQVNEFFVHQMLLNNDQNEVRRNKAIVYGHQRIVWPLYNIAITIIVISVLSQTYKYREGSNAKFYIVFGISISLLILNFILQNLAMKNLYYINLMYALVISVVFLFFYQLSKSDKKSV